MKNTLLGSLYLILASSIWGGMYVVIKIVVSVILPLELVWMRYLVAIVVFLVIGFITRQNWRIKKRYFLLIVAIGVIGNAVSIVAQEAVPEVIEVGLGPAPFFNSVKPKEAVP
ncbi:drug/metabolite transporter (DMT)-like permease [Paenibacillus brasilensis]|uniref:Drug/metabolite transporter (DMT)-like permease n=1 Tax=Paenibacillus brasilensis TaxID=128574 RepID=A0ABU0KXT3_9BACL|nr:drug/metabolite transporter (DMT)-like permease [Paenibacillus brasilensis]